MVKKVVGIISWEHVSFVLHGVESHITLANRSHKRTDARPRAHAHSFLFILTRAEGEQLKLRRRQARADRFKAEFFAILREHQTRVTDLMEEAVGTAAEAADASRLSEARNDALQRLTENFARRQESVA